MKALTLMPVTTLSEVARHAGVSTSVVSRILNGDTKLRTREDTKERVRAAAEALAYRPNHAARALRMAHADAIGLMVPDVTNAVFAEVLRGVEAAANVAGLQILLGRSEQLHADGMMGRLLGEGRVDGFLIQRGDESDMEDFAELAERQMPVVLLNSRRARRGSVVLEDSRGAAMATEHLVELGHRNIAMIGGTSTSDTSRRREEGYRRALSGAGLRRRKAWTTRCGYASEDGRRAVHMLFAPGGAHPTAIFVANVNAAVGVVLGARQLGLRIPEDISVVAVHDTWVSGFTSPPLTVVRMPLYQLGFRGVESLRARLTGGPATDLVIDDPAPELVIRASAGPPPRR